jgi:hypothetical protein
MHKFLISAALISAAAIAAPATAQYQSRGHYGYDHRGGQGIQRQLQQLVQRIRMAEDRDLISRREESRLLREANRINDRLYSYSRNGLSHGEHQDLQQRIHRLRQEIREERREGREDRRDDRRGDYRRGW